MINNCVIKHLILLKIQSMMDIKVVLLHSFIIVLIKNLPEVVLKMRIFQKNNWLKNNTNQLLENSRKEKYTHLLQTIFGC